VQYKSQTTERKTMEREMAEEIFVSGWMAAITAYGVPADKNEEEVAKEAFYEEETRYPGIP
jgi:ABC-type molybdenum transport system ATPase subunit/photorepair protein PhrA